MLSLQSSKVKNARPTFSVADAANAKRKGSHKVVAPLDAEEEACVLSSCLPISIAIQTKVTNAFTIRHLSTLDSSLSALIRPLTAPGGSTHSQLPSLLFFPPHSPHQAP